MSDWQVGDLALCVKLEPWRLSGTNGPRSGHIYRVDVVTVNLWGETGLIFHSLPSLGYRGGWNANRFIKVTPPEADAFDRETIDLLNREPVEA